MPARRLLQSLLLFACLLGAAAARCGDLSPNGIFLVASPALEDPWFQHSVVLVTQRPDRSTLGVIVNRPTEVALRDLFPGSEPLRASPEPVFFGGPVSRNSLVFVLRGPTAPQNTLQVLNDLWLGSDPEVLLALLDRAGDAALRVYSGYAGWAPDQLAAEVARGSWYLVPADAESVFAREPESLWEDMVRRATGRPVRGDPSPGATPARAWLTTLQN